MKISKLFPIILFLTSVALFPQNSGVVSLNLVPGFSVPLGDDADAFDYGGGLSLTGQLGIPALSFLYLEGGAGFSVSPLKIASGETTDVTSMYLLSPRIGVGVDFELFPKFSLGAKIHGGYYYGFLDGSEENSSGSNPLIETGFHIRYRLFPSLSLGVETSYRNFLGLYNDLMVSIGTTYHFKSSSSGGLLAPDLKPYKELSVSELELNDIFPVFFKYYEDHPIGSLVLENRGKIPMENVEIKVFINQYMDNPTLSKEMEFFKGGEKKVIDLYALLNDSVLDLSESTKVQINTTVELDVAGERYGNEIVQTIRLYDRNATTWEDDRRAAAFVTLKDPTVLKFSKNITNMVKGKIQGSLNSNFLTILSIHEALRLYGISYVIDPTTPYAEFSKNKMNIDYLQFPNQTMEYRAGDCDDLSILYCAFMESLGINTAFITIPGHIYMAVALNLSPEEAGKQFLDPGALIFRDDNTWLPLEITMVEDGFLKAWATGAKEWRGASKNGQEGFFPVREAWKLYEPVGFSGQALDLEMPEEAEVVEAFIKEVNKFIEVELHSRVTDLEKKIKETRDNYRAVNSLGVLYARYGLYDKAEVEFQKIVRQTDFAPALMNMGNLAFAGNRMEDALDYYIRADRKRPGKPQVVLNLARVNYELGKYEQVEKYYSQLLGISERLAERFRYLDMKKGDSTARASESGIMRGEMVWYEE